MRDYAIRCCFLEFPKRIWHKHETRDAGCMGGNANASEFRNQGKKQHATLRQLMTFDSAALCWQHHIASPLHRRGEGDRRITLNRAPRQSREHITTQPAENIAGRKRENLPPPPPVPDPEIDGRRSEASRLSSHRARALMSAACYLWASEGKKILRGDRSPEGGIGKGARASGMERAAQRGQRRSEERIRGDGWRLAQIPPSTRRVSPLSLASRGAGRRRARVSSCAAVSAAFWAGR
ncbi:hypothetical protein GUJ93_ZPchr0013g37258 [Zizania palustris]|uniref:Uncharacterized protein n=1 Tax=Zizania palustris TaxID=103762 RepID=A0A8J5WYE7_ZIZPA|nr:hypothetical protein GUJ93_ZPchr0013g37258 [Zizania palustris]